MKRFTKIGLNLFGLLSVTGATAGCGDVEAGNKAAATVSSGAAGIAAAPKTLSTAPADVTKWLDSKVKVIPPTESVAGHNDGFNF